jgi:hypothetical protein
MRHFIQLTTLCGAHQMIEVNTNPLSKFGKKYLVPLPGSFNQSFALDPVPMNSTPRTRMFQFEGQWERKVSDELGQYEVHNYKEET